MITQAIPQPPAQLLPPDQIQKLMRLDTKPSCVDLLLNMALVNMAKNANLLMAKEN